MKVRSGKTVLLPESFRGGTDDVGQIASTMCVDVSIGEIIKQMSRMRCMRRNSYIPTRFSTKLCLRSDCLTSDGGRSVRVEE
jgi:hypothetical protein